MALTCPIFLCSTSVKLGAHGLYRPCALNFFYDWQVTELYTFRIKIGNIITDILTNHSYVKKICEPYFSDEQANCKICIDKADIDDERKALLKIGGEGERPHEETADRFVEVYAVLHKLLEVLPCYDMLFMHGSAIQFNGKAYIFVAPSGTGKSTHTRLWKERFGEAVTVINDDKPFLVFRHDKVYLCGTPWRGKHNIGQNLTAELGGICILSRGEINRIYHVDGTDAVRDIIQQSNLHRYKNNAVLALDLIDKLLKTIPVYRLFCTATPEAVDVCYNEIFN